MRDRPGPNLIADPATALANVPVGCLDSTGEPAILLEHREDDTVEQSLTDGEVIEQVKDFLDIISTAFMGLAAVTEDDPEAERKSGELTAAQELRKSSLLGSTGTLRVLGAVFRELRLGDNPVELDDISVFFKRLDRHMAAPVTENSIWRTSDANVDFEPDAAAPIMRTQNLIHLVSVITGWYKKAPAAL